MNDMNRGKDKCEILKRIRKYVAEEYGLDYEPTDCTHKGNCMGTCPKCDAELLDLQEQLRNKGVVDIAADKKLSGLIEEYAQENPKKTFDDLSIADGRTMGMPSPMVGEIWNYSPSGKLFLECKVAGTQYHHVDEILSSIWEGQRIYLVRDSENEHDSQAVAVSLEEPYWDDASGFDFSQILGYVPRGMNATLAAMLDMGWQSALEAIISKVDPNSTYDKLYISIYLKSRDQVVEDELEDKKNLLRMMSLTDDELTDLEERLYEKGYVYYRWLVSSPLLYHNYSKKGDRVVFFHHAADGSYQLYLMKVLASGDESLPYLDSPNELFMHDDCSPFVLTNIKGPVTVDEDDFEEILKGKEAEFNGHPDILLPKRVSDALLEFFEIADLEV